MVELSTREHALNLVAKNPEWNVLDLGCGIDGIKAAHVYADVENYTNDYPEKRFVQTSGSKTPFKDKEFDFVFSLHIAEHVLDPFKFCEELTRIGKRGFIEVPTPFFDNLVQGNANPPPHGHVWWVTFDNLKKQIVFRPRLQIVAEMVSPSATTVLLPFFRESMVTEIYWESSIELRQEDSYYKYVSGNSDPPRIVDLRNKEIPSHITGWRPSKS